MTEKPAKWPLDMYVVAEYITPHTPTHPAMKPQTSNEDLSSYPEPDPEFESPDRSGTLSVHWVEFSESRGTQRIRLNAPQTPDRPKSLLGHVQPSIDDPEVSQAPKNAISEPGDGPRNEAGQENVERDAAIEKGRRNDLNAKSDQVFVRAEFASPLRPGPQAALDLLVGDDTTPVEELLVNPPAVWAGVAMVAPVEPMVKTVDCPWTSEDHAQMIRECQLFYGLSGTVGLYKGEDRTYVHLMNSPLEQGVCRRGELAILKAVIDLASGEVMSVAGVVWS